MLHLVKPAEGDGLDILVSATAVPIDDERLRLAAVMRYEILDTAPEAACDRITALAADLFNVPISIIGFVDRDRIWFKSHHGLDATEIERDAAGGAAVLPSIGFTLPSGTKTDVWLTDICSTDIRFTELRSTELRSTATPHVVGKAGRRFCIAVPRTFAAEPSAERLPILAYLRRLCGELADILETAVEIEGIEATIPTEQILALGLIANELVTNAKKHGAGTIKVTFRTCSRGEYELCVLDEGPGLPKGFALERHSAGSLGMKLVALLVSQLDGRLSAGANPAGRGACFTVAFPHS